MPSPAVAYPGQPGPPARRSPPGPAAAYGFAAGITAAALGTRAALGPVLGEIAPLILLLMAPMLAALYGGLGPGLAATAASGFVGEALFVPPYGSPIPPSAAEAVRLAVFLVAGGAFSWVVHLRNRAIDDLQAQRNALVDAQTRLVNRERRLTEVLEAAPSAMLVSDPAGRILLVNRQAERIFGHARDDLLGLRIEDLVPENVRERHAGLRQSYLAAPTARPMGAGRELLARRRDGSTFPVEVGLNPLGGDGRGDGRGEILVSVVDITQRLAAEAALLDTERQFRVLFEWAPVAFYVVEPRTGRFLGCNAKGAAQLGYTVDEIERMSIADINARHGPDVLPGMLKGIAHGAPLHVETVHRDKAGELHDVLVSAHAMDVQGTRLILAAAQDITERKRMEDALKAADRQKDDFLAMLAHELRNPLAPLSMGLTLLLRDPQLDDTARRTVEMGLRQTRQLTHLVNDLLEVARISRGQVSLAKELVAMQDIAGGALESVQPIFAEKRQHVAVDMPRERLQVEADPARMQQVLENLLHNAAKFTSPGGRISLSVALREERVVTVVEDSGVGIDPADLPQLFAPFAQVAPSIDRSQGGLGLGLALVKRLVEIHGGQVEAHSDGRDRGARFCVSLPIARLAPQEPASAPHVPAESAPGAKRVLVVDDNKDAANTLAELLTLEGHDVTVAYDGQEALDRAAASAPQLAILDIGLPGMDGYELARRLRAAPGGQSLVLAALTGYGQPADRAFAKQAGFDHHLLKPVDLNALMALLD